MINTNQKPYVFRQRGISCPICKNGKINIDEWYYPKTIDEPVDCGFEVTHLDKKCKCTDEKIMDFVFHEREKFDKNESDEI